MYESPYDQNAIEQQAATVSSLTRSGHDVWTIYDNTTYGAATQNAFDLATLLAEKKG
ncbi:UPF0759 protein yunF [Gluconobacter morbifer G707]|uniref:UPF0759 protein yunF n=2 Tax=Gluconobacter TaxID=441 RepID=G6XL95_9PROT|nr:UPF0759 protein yunF [Gluconobacter morbifer G707]